jgi:acyl carrier protein
LAELRTLGQIVEHVRPTLGTPAPIPAERSSEPIPASALAPQNSALAPADVSSGPGMGTLTESLLTIVSEKTGYPTDMLDLTMDMEADLGIDSIKRVEILGALQERHPDLPKIEPQALAELRTLGQIVNYLQTGPDPKKA